jgi:hypothetical protein
MPLGPSGPRRTSAASTSSDGGPLTFHSAIKSKDEDKWQVAEIEELMRLSPEQSQTLFPVHMAAVPHDRRGDITYRNTKPKEKLDADGKKTCRIRGTAGGDKINYPKRKRAGAAG